MPTYCYERKLDYEMSSKRSRESRSSLEERNSTCVDTDCCRYVTLTLCNGEWNTRCPRRQPIPRFGGIISRLLCSAWCDACVGYIVAVVYVQLCVRLYVPFIFCAPSFILLHSLHDLNGVLYV
eukprot:m.88788 g.88788  ORF g.88788 m.88788 type:complete len:123 (-) comp12867_c0_seq8:3559-3927(-)